jgi:hypothetical protein
MGTYPQLMHARTTLLGAGFSFSSGMAETRALGRESE